MDEIKVEQAVLVGNSEQIVDTYISDTTDIDEAIENHLDYDTSKFPSDAKKVKFLLYEDDYAHSVIFSNFKGEWYGSDYKFEFRSFSIGGFSYSVNGTEVDVANYLYDNIEEIAQKYSLQVNVNDFKSRIEPDDQVIEELIEELNSDKKQFEFIDA